ncbi:MAG: hypothetical protein ACI4PO_01670 [Faecousia sp.]
MENLKDYLIGMTAAALVCGIVNAYFDRKGTIGAILKLASGIFLILTIASPLVKLQFEKILDITEDFRISGEAAAAWGQSIGEEALSSGIISRAEAYILDKAESLGAELSVQVEVSVDEIPVPKTVRISGKVSPYEKSVLTNYIEMNLGIPPEDQIWIGK